MQCHLLVTVNLHTILPWVRVYKSKNEIPGRITLMIYIFLMFLYLTIVYFILDNAVHLYVNGEVFCDPITQD